MNKYTQCIEEDWVETWACVDGLRYSEGQQGKWPEDRCFEDTNPREHHHGR